MAILPRLFRQTPFFVLGLDEKLTLMNNLRSGFDLEFQVSKQHKYFFDKKFRSFRTKVENSFIDDYFSQLLLNWEQSIKPVIDQIIIKAKENPISSSLENLLPSYTHMTINRLFPSRQRENEWAIYHILYRYYYSVKAKMKYATKD